MALLRTRNFGERLLRPIAIEDNEPVKTTISKPKILRRVVEHDAPEPLKRPVLRQPPAREIVKEHVKRPVLRLPSPVKEPVKKVDIVESIKKTTWPELKEPKKVVKPTINANLPKVSNEVKDAINKGLQSDNPIIRQKAESVLKEKIKEEAKNPTKTKVLQASTKFDFKKGVIIGVIILVVGLLIRNIK